MSSSLSFSRVVWSEMGDRLQFLSPLDLFRLTLDDCVKRGKNGDEE